jgi:urease subunit gamma/beta
MHLTPHESDKLALHQAGVVAQKRLARGLKLNYPEAVALISAQLLEFIREGRSVAELMDLGRRFLGRAELMDGVPEMIEEVQVEGTFPDGSKLVTVHHPIAAERGDLALALYGSFLPVPHPSDFAKAEPRPSRIEGEAGEVTTVPGTLILNEGRETLRLSVANMGDRPIQVGSHYPFAEANRALVFDRAKAYGMRLDIPAGTSRRFEPGQTRIIELVAIAGKKVVRGGNRLAEGPVTEKKRAKVADSAKKLGFGHKEVKR